jgi:hypothetical protein
MDYCERKIVLIHRFRVFASLWVGIMLVSIPSLHADELGRLFFSPAERKAMNERRASPPPKPIANAPKKESVEPDVQESTEAGESVRLPNPKMTGKVIRSSGNNTIWFNQYPQYKRANNRTNSD